MTESLRERAGELVVTRCWCGVQHGVPKSLYDMQRRQKDDGERQVGIYCPIGHVWTLSGEGESDRLRKQLVRERARLDQERARGIDLMKERDHAERRRRAERGAKTRIMRRVAAGVCPCCRRSFENLARHMSAKHPGYAESES